MKKIVIHSPGDHDKLKLEHGTIDDLKVNEVQVDVMYSGVNYADVCVRWGIYESAKKFIGWPITPGFEFSGVISKVHENSKFKVGDEVFGVSFFNGYSSKLNLPEHFVFKKPSSLSFEEAACFPAVFLTAYHALFQNFIMRPRSNVLVHSAAGGVGSALVQLLKQAGHNTVGVIGSSGKREYLSSLNCDHIIDKSKEDLWKRAEEICPTGYDVILDANGVETLRDSFNHLAPTGKLMVYGFHTMLPKSGRINWPKLVWNYLRTPRFSPLELTSANKSVMAFNLSFLFERFDILLEGMEAMIKMLESGSIKGHRVTVFDASDVGHAHGHIESGKSVGKIALKW
ncbi:medium chain dehydrogenase/reductase family protein [Bacteriovorax sp. Seq25_V]|uniref:synaptic vesicle VAT-1 family membrane protein n=1 Tax=Bacteriovorax sp. Seq25_V TaxID=1201288 RepID=UPI000389E670|nr:medium chain dehydrogenase/reductase family protein [Bacteriovorax sp. Seq25_V]EQC46251.1 oxidoreductase, zinc-binding dehydrogenase family protein [Bacteriovorax sp. Seq25_V]